MSLCVAASGKSLVIAAQAFTLAWTHSVEKTGWHETWAATDRALRLVEARVRGSGAGMEPGPGAALRDGWWVWSPDNPPIPALVLAASGETGTGWRLCHAGGCIELGAQAGDPVTIRPCPDK